MLIVEECIELEDVYDITVKNNHNFFANDILVHNCQEIAIPTKGYNSVGELYQTEYDESQGEVGLCSLAAIVASNIKDEAEYAKAAYYCLLMIHTAIHESDYELPQVGYTAKARNSAGVGLIGLAHWMAKHKLSYSSQEGRNAIHKLFETHYWHLVNASLKMSEEFGLAKWMHKTKWPDGWTPLNTYNRNIDKIVTVENQYDWEGLSKRIKENGGIHNSVLSCEMPAESCLEKSTKIRLGNGDLISLEEIFAKTGKNIDDEIYSKFGDIFCMNEDRWYDLPEPIYVQTQYGIKPCERVWLNGYSNYIEFEMEDGYKIKVTHSHKFLVKVSDDKYEWKMALDIEEGDDIVSI